jgi:hypothetical protein
MQCTVSNFDGTLHNKYASKALSAPPLRLIAMLVQSGSKGISTPSISKLFIEIFTEKTAHINISSKCQLTWNLNIITTTCRALAKSEIISYIQV